MVRSRFAAPETGAKRPCSKTRTRLERLRRNRTHAVWASNGFASTYRRAPSWYFAYVSTLLYTISVEKIEPTPSSLFSRACSPVCWVLDPGPELIPPIPILIRISASSLAFQHLLRGLLGTRPWSRTDSPILQQIYIVYWRYSRKIHWLRADRCWPNPLLARTA